MLRLERAKAYCKINEFENATADAEACSEYFRDKDILSYIRAEAIKNTVMRDQERWADASMQGRRMVEVAQSAGGRRAQMIAYHALARSLALAGETSEALNFSDKALDVSVTAEERGEALFAKGEAFRHQGNIFDALKEYGGAERTTYISGKTDLYIWCKLCIADCHFMEDAFDKTEEQLE
jgi:tetratricopeptide (TPR) repeat protein